jgi:hypothetical protein
MRNTLNYPAAADPVYPGRSQSGVPQESWVRSSILSLSAIGARVDPSAYVAQFNALREL